MRLGFCGGGEDQVLGARRIAGDVDVIFRSKRWTAIPRPPPKHQGRAWFCKVFSSFSSSHLPPPPQKKNKNKKTSLFTRRKPALTMVPVALLHTQGTHSWLPICMGVVYNLNNHICSFLSPFSQQLSSKAYNSMLLHVIF